MTRNPSYPVWTVFYNSPDVSHLMICPYIVLLLVFDILICCLSIGMTLHTIASSFKSQVSDMSHSLTETCHFHIFSLTHQRMISFILLLNLHQRGSSEITACGCKIIAQDLDMASVIFVIAAPCQFVAVLGSPIHYPPELGPPH